MVDNRKALKMEDMRSVVCMFKGGFEDATDQQIFSAWENLPEDAQSEMLSKWANTNTGKETNEASRSKKEVFDDSKPASRTSGRKQT